MTIDAEKDTSHLAAVPVSPLDATVEMERPKSLPARPASRRFEEIKSPTTKALASSPTPAQDATVEMARPSDLEKAPASSSAPPLDATVDMPRPNDLKEPSAPVPPLDATVEISHPNDLKKTPTPVPPLDATVEMSRPGELKKTPLPTQPQDATVEMSRPGDSKKSPAPGAGFDVADALDRRKIASDRQTPIGARDSGTGMRPTPVPAGSPGAPFSKKIGEVLVEMGKLTREQLDESVQMAQAAGERLGRWLIRWGLVQPDVMCRALSIQSGLPMTMLDGDAIPEHLSKLFPLPLMMHHNFVPFDDSGAVLCLAACNPLDPELLKEQEKNLRKVVEVFLAREDQVARQLDWLRVKMKTRSRRSLRFDMRLSVTFQYCNRLGVRLDKEIHAGTTRNISEGGFLLDAPAHIADPGEMLRKGMYVNACIKSLTGEIWAICDVREVRLIEDPHHPRWLMGVEILDINADSKARLKQFCRKPAVKN